MSLFIIIIKHCHPVKDPLTSSVKTEILIQVFPFETYQTSSIPFGAASYASRIDEKADDTDINRISHPRA